MRDVADLLVVASTIWRRRDLLSLDKELQDVAIVRLNNYGVLSTSALGSVVGVSPYRVKQALRNREMPTARGHLNPAHISMLMYALSLGDITPRWIGDMVAGGTSLSTIADLTGISERTLYRKKP